MNHSDHTLKFGFYRGVPLSAIPTSYLLEQDSVCLSADDLEAVSMELDNRNLSNEKKSTGDNTKGEMDV